MHNFIWISNTMPKSGRKTNDPVPRKCSDRDGQINGWKERQTIFYRTFPAIAAGPTRLQNVTCNCRDNSYYPLHGNCLQSGIIYCCKSHCKYYKQYSMLYWTHREYIQSM